MAKFDYEVTCDNCYTKIRGMSPDSLDLELKRHSYKKHPLMYSVNQGYTIIVEGVAKPLKTDSEYWK